MRLSFHLHGFFKPVSAPLFAALACLSAQAADGDKMQFGAAGWMQYGVIMKSFMADTTSRENLDGRPMISSGAQILLKSQISDKLSIEAGLGVGAGHALSAELASQGGYAPLGVGPYVAQANFTYSFRGGEGSGAFLRGGLFGYDYAPEAQNLGLYLLRGPVYPGVLISGFETKHVLPVANMLGLQLHHELGGFYHDLLLNVDTEFHPFFDLSPAYILGYKLGRALRVGAGVNFYHLIAIEDSLTKYPDRFLIDTLGFDSLGNPIESRNRLTFAGTKLMANFSFDLKALMGGAGSFGPEDLKLYGEVGVIGLRNDSIYKRIYGDVKQRMPVMIGFNVPAFGFLDHFAVEFEHYGAPFEDNLDGFKHVAANKISPLPYAFVDTANIKEDNVKWSVHASKVFRGHVKLSLQVANDHFRPGIFTGYGDNNPPGLRAVTTRSSDWYWMTKIAYFF